MQKEYFNASQTFVIERQPSKWFETKDEKKLKLNAFLLASIIHVLKPQCGRHNNEIS